MTLIRWEPAREYSALQADVNRLFTSFLDPGDPARVARWVPPMDLRETDAHYLLDVDLPGMAQEDLVIEMDGDTLTISGQRAASGTGEEVGFVRRERAGGVFRRTVTLPEGTDGEAINAELEHGVLTVRVPKPEQKQPRRIEITVGKEPVLVEA